VYHGRAHGSDEDGAGCSVLPLNQDKTDRLLWVCMPLLLMPGSWCSFLKLQHASTFSKTELEQKNWAVWLARSLAGLQDGVQLPVSTALNTEYWNTEY
jgi:hypothetical protein